MHPLVQALLTAIQYAPQAINEITALYSAVRGDFNETDQAKIDQALAAAQTADAQATATAGAALDEAAKR